jgi:hypothetical protein
MERATTGLPEMRNPGGARSILKQCGKISGGLHCWIQGKQVEPAPVPLGFVSALQLIVSAPRGSGEKWAE